MSPGVIEGFFLIESRADESDQAFCTAVEDILQQIHTKPKWWYPFKAGARFVRGSTVFREFECIAGSVSCHLLLRAGRDGGIPRAIVYREERDGVRRAYEVRNGVQSEFNPDEIHPITSAP